MKRLALALLLVLLLALVSGASAQSAQLAKCTAHITSATTTTPTGCSAVTGGSIELWNISICLGVGGVATNITLQDGAGTNLVGTSIVYPLPNVGACLTAPYRGFRYFNATASGQAFQIVTSAAGPVEVYIEVAK